MTCETCRESLGLLMEHDFQANPEIMLHIASCSDCGKEYEQMLRAHRALRAFSPPAPPLGEAFTQAVLVRARREARPALPFARWGALAAASVLLMVSVGLGIRGLSHGFASSTGFRVLRADGHREEPYRPGAPLNPGDVVVADRGGSLPMGGRLVGMGPGGILWVPGEVRGTAPSSPFARPVFAFSDEHSVQVVSAPAGIAWSTTPGQRRRYLHELVELAEGQDAQVADLARGELKRVLMPDEALGNLGHGAGGELADADGEILPDDTGTVLFPVAARSARALGGPGQGASLDNVSRALAEVMGLVGERYLPTAVSRFLQPAPEGL